MAAIEDEKVFGLKIRESANDGSDFGTPDADYRFFFLGEDGEMHTKDSADAISDPFSGTLASGTGFPGGPSTDDIFYRTDRSLLYFYNGTRWLTVTLYIMEGVASTFTGTSSFFFGVPKGGVYDLWLEDFQISFIVVGGTALGASHKWVVQAISRPGASTLQTVNIDSGASDTYRNSGEQAIDALLGTTNFMIQGACTKTGTPGNLTATGKIYFRMVG